MTQFLQATLYGLLQGGLLALVAVGFSLVWGVMNVVNLAHGAFVLGGAYVALELHEAFGLDPFVSMVPAAALLFCIGYLLQRYLINLVINAPIFITLILTFALAIDVRVPYGKLIAALLAVAVTVALVYFMRRSRTGLSILATGMDRGAARLMGIRARHVYALTFGIAAAMAGAAGAAEGAVRTFSPADARYFTLFSFVVAVLGGLGNMWGALYGGLLLGLVMSWGSQLLSGTMINAVAFAVLVIVLAVRPQGLAGKAFYASRVEV